MKGIMILLCCTKPQRSNVSKLKTIDVCLYIECTANNQEFIFS